MSPFFFAQKKTVFRTMNIEHFTLTITCWALVVISQGLVDLGCIGFGRLGRNVGYYIRGWDVLQNIEGVGKTKATWLTLSEGESVYSVWGF